MYLFYKIYNIFFFFQFQFIIFFLFNFFINKFLKYRNDLKFNYKLRDY